MTLLSAFNHKKVAKNILSSKLGTSLSIGLGLKELVFDESKLSKFQKKNSQDAQTLIPANFSSLVYKAHYGKVSENDLIPDDKLSHSQSFVPYFRGVTNLIIYNFFSRNYSIRDPLLYRFTIMNGKTPCFIQNKILASDEVFLYEDPSLKHSEISFPESGTLIVQVFHPRIKTPSNQLRYFALYRDTSAHTISAVHALPLPPKGIAPVFKPTFRSFGPKQNMFYHTCSETRLPMFSSKNDDIIPKQTIDKKIFATIGYLTVHENKNLAPLAIWHDGPTSNEVKRKEGVKTTSACQTAFFVPNFETHAPCLFISTSQVGFKSRKLIIEAKNSAGQIVATESAPLQKEDSSIDLRETFSRHSLRGDLNFIVKFDRNLEEFENYPACYIHLYYRSGSKWSDQVHSHSTIGYASDPSPKAKSYRCRKFAPIWVGSGLKFIYSISNVGGTQQKPTEIKLRVLTDLGGEHILKFPVPMNTLLNIEGKDILSKIGNEIKNVGIVQLEHDSINFNASWFAIDETSGHVGVDHFTGG